MQRWPPPQSALVSHGGASPSGTSMSVAVATSSARTSAGDSAGETPRARAYDTTSPATPLVFPVASELQPVPGVDSARLPP
jgi:hypothetical protein